MPKSDMSCATDKEIYDLLISGKRKLSEAVLLELARDRGIFYSSKTDREMLVNDLSLLTYDYYDIGVVVDRRDSTARSDKTTSIELKVGDITIDDLKDIVTTYKEEEGQTDSVSFHQVGEGALAVNIKYDDIDYSKTRLIQRQPKEAGVEIIIKDDLVTIRYPATEKSESIISTLCHNLESQKKAIIDKSKIELTGLSNPDDRTRFFTDLISTIPGYKLETVTSLKVFSNKEDFSEDIDLEESEENSAEQNRMLAAVVHNIVLNGTNLVASKEYQELKKGGFYITSIKWRSKELASPYHMVQFEASFDDGMAGTEFKYTVKYASKMKSGEYTKQFKQYEDKEKSKLCELIEVTSRSILEKIFQSIQEAEEGGK